MSRSRAFPLLLAIFTLMLVVGALPRPTAASPGPTVSVTQEDITGNPYIVFYGARFCYGYTAYDRWGHPVNAYRYLYWSDGTRSYVIFYDASCPGSSGKSMGVPANNDKAETHQTSGWPNVGPSRSPAYVTYISSIHCYGYTVYYRFGRVNYFYNVYWSDGYVSYLTGFSYACPT